MIKTYIIKDADGNRLNTIRSTESFVSLNYEHYEEAPVVIDHYAVSREWRDNELVATDIVAQTPDWPNRDAILVYRQALRDWPSTEDFPDTRPILGGA